MPTQHMSPDDLLFYFGVANHPRVFLLGCTEPRVTVHDQQVRAANLIWALAQAKVARVGQRIGIIGGGFAGVTAAVAALKVGLRPVVFDHQDRACMLQEGSSRWIHPRLYDWPDEGWDEPHALPFTTWEAAPASDIVSRIRGELQDHGLTITGPVDVQRIDASTSRVTVTFATRRRLGTAAPSTEIEFFPLVIISVGFGTERHLGYWEPDQLDVDKGPERWAVAGMGDGALIDTARLRLSRSNYYTTLQRVADYTIPSVRKQIGALERAAKNLARGGASKVDLSMFLHDGTQRIVRNNESVLSPVYQALQLRDDTEVKLVAPLPSPHSLSASALNRWVITLLLHWDDRLHFATGRLEGQLRIDGHTKEDLSNFRLHLRTGSRRIFPDSRDAELPQPWLRPFHQALFADERRSAPGLDGPRHPQWPKGFWSCDKPVSRSTARTCDAYFAVENCPSAEVFELMLYTDSIGGVPSIIVLIPGPAAPTTEPERYNYVERLLRERHGPQTSELLLFQANIDLVHPPLESKEISIQELDQLVDIRRYEG